MIRCGVAFLLLLTAFGLVSCAVPVAPAQPTVKAPAAAQPRSLPPRRITAVATPPPQRPAGMGKLTRIALGDFFAKQQAGTALTFDVRPAFFYRLGHVPGAISWPKNQYEASLSGHLVEIDTATAAGKTVVLYCTDLACPDARTVGTRLAERGLSVTLLEGGWEAWKSGELPTE
jgi:rhodanese-related sulfurtransferase